MRTVADIITDALDKNYSVEQAATDLGEFMNERELIKQRYGTDSSRLTELRTLIPIQEQLALRKLHGEQAFEQLARLNLRLEKHD